MKEIRKFFPDERLLAERTKFADFFVNRPFSRKRS